MSSVAITDSRSEQRKALDEAILEATEELRSIIPNASSRDDAMKLATTIRDLVEARRAL